MIIKTDTYTDKYIDIAYKEMKHIADTLLKEKFSNKKFIDFCKNPDIVIEKRYISSLKIQTKTGFVIHSILLDTDSYYVDTDEEFIIASINSRVKAMLDRFKLLEQAEEKLGKIAVNRIADQYKYVVCRNGKVYLSPKVVSITPNRKNLDSLINTKSDTYTKKLIQLMKTRCNSIELNHINDVKFVTVDNNEYAKVPYEYHNVQTGLLTLGAHYYGLTTNIPTQETVNRINAKIRIADIAN